MSLYENAKNDNAAYTKKKNAGEIMQLNKFVKGESRDSIVKI